jgi:hypothetical protein
MSTTTTHHHDARSGEPTAPEPGRRRQRLGVLLARRDRVVARGAEALSHGLANAADLAHELAVIEQGIGHCWPKVYDAKLSDWVARDAGLIHSPDNPHVACSICGASGVDTPHAA